MTSTPDMPSPLSAALFVLTVVVGVGITVAAVAWWVQS